MVPSVECTLLAVYMLHFTADFAVTATELCHRFTRKENVTIDTIHCLLKNYTEPKPNRLSIAACLKHDAVSVEKNPKRLYRATIKFFIILIRRIG